MRTPTSPTDAWSGQPQAKAGDAPPEVLNACESILPLCASLKERQTREEQASPYQPGLQRHVPAGLQPPLKEQSASLSHTVSAAEYRARKPLRRPISSERKITLARPSWRRSA
eukprot:scaffold6705_cov31-Tisochrysis_lutea.AAC.8